MRTLIAVAALVLAASCALPASHAPSHGAAPIAGAPKSGQLLLLEFDAARSSDSTVLGKTAGILRKRLADAGIASWSVTPISPNRVEVRLPPAPDSAGLISILTRPGALSFHLADASAEPFLTNADIATIDQAFDQANSPNLQFKLTPEGAKKLADVTAANIDKTIAIVLDGAVLVAPRIMSPITGGEMQVTGNFDLREMRQAALIVRSGALPAKLTLIETTTFGAR